MTIPSRVNSNFKHAFFGGAASTISTLAYLIQDRRGKNLPPMDALVFDPKGLNVGLGYDVTNPAFVLNQPRGQEMDPFHNGGPGLPLSFTAFLKREYPGQDFPETGEDNRPHYGDYLRYVIAWVREEAPKSGVIIEETFSRAEHLDVVGVDASGKPVELLVTDSKGLQYIVHDFTVATGHTIEPRIKEPHRLYVGSYHGDDFEARLKDFAVNSTPESVLTYAGSGAANVDIIAAVEHWGYKGVHSVISPYGKTYWQYDPQAAKPSDPALVTSLVDGFIRDSRTNPLAALRSALDKAPSYGVAPQYFLTAVLEHPAVIARKELLDLAKTFYGNPLLNGRFDLMERLSVRTANSAPPRLQFEIGRADNPQPAGPDALTIDIFDGAATKVLHEPLIDCTITGRGIRRKDGSIAQPLIEDILRFGLLGEDNGALVPRSKDGLPGTAVGVVTNARKNGIESFRPGYSTTGKAIAQRAESFAPVRVFRPVAWRNYTA